MTDNELKHLCYKVRDIAAEVGDYIRAEAEIISQIEIEEKEFNSFVTRVDKNAEEKLVIALKPLIPDAGFITEEETIAYNSDKEFIWIIDPLDGTTNFIQNIPAFCISIALQQNKRTVLGVIFEVNLKECFYAWNGSEAFLNENPIKVTEKKNLKDAMIGTGFPYSDFTRIHPYLATVHHFLVHTRGMRRIGTAALDLAYVACGRFDGYFEYGLSPWDVAAGAFIVERAGGKVTTFSGGEDFIFGKEVLACNSNMYDKIYNVIHENFRNS